MPTGNKKMFRLLRRFRHIGKYRDSALVGVGLVYLLGYAVWFIIAWKQGLGPVPILDIQYFVAGLPVLLIVAASILAFDVLHSTLLKGLPGWLEKRDPWQLKLLYFLVAILVFLWIFVGYALFGPIDSRSEGHDPPKLVDRLWTMATFGWVVVVGVLVICLSQIENADKAGQEGESQEHRVASPAKNHAHTKRSHADRLLPWPTRLMLVIVALSAVFVYIADIYTAIPPEFGGAKPRTAQLDLARDSFSAEMIETLTTARASDPNEAARASDPNEAAPASDPNEKAFQTKRVDVLFAGSQYLIIDPAPEDPNSRDRVEISRDAIKAILWRRDR